MMSLEFFVDMAVVSTQPLVPRVFPGGEAYRCIVLTTLPPSCADCLGQRFSNFFQVGTTFISQNVLRTTLLLGLSNSLGLP